MFDSSQQRSVTRVSRPKPWRDLTVLDRTWVRRSLRVVVIAALLGSVGVAVVGTRAWPVVGDAPLMHYVAFLLDHGKAPYREIVDVNLPGTYAMEWAAIHLLGPGDAGWRVFDLGLLAACAGAMTVIAAPVDWLAGLYAGVLFALVHFRDGPANSGQRDLMMTTMLLLGCMFLFEALRRRWMWLALGFGLCVGMAATIKPTGLVFAAALLVMLWVRLRSLKVKAAGYLLLGVVGFAAPVVACVGWLVRHGALRAFWETDRGLMAYHASLGRPALFVLLVGSFPSVLLAVAIPALPLLWAEKPWRQWGGAVLCVAFVLGCASYVVQGKGFPYHRYPGEAFLLLLCALLLMAGLKQASWKRWPALVGVLAGALVLAPLSAQIACHLDGRNQEFNWLLTADLNALGGPEAGALALDGKVQCVDMTSGCLNTLYNLQVVQATGYLYDCYLFQPKQTPVSEAYRAGFWKAIEETKPDVMVVTDQECFSLARRWDLPERWPQFAELLANNYTLVAQRTPPDLVGWWRHPQVPYSYRLYVRRGVK